MRSAHVALQILIATACYTAQDVASARCDTMCKRLGYDWGSFKNDGQVCACVDEVTWEATLAKRTAIHAKKIRVKADVVIPPMEQYNEIETAPWSY